MYNAIYLKKYKIMLICYEREIHEVCDVINERLENGEEIDDILEDICVDYDCNVVDFKEI